MKHVPLVMVASVSLFAIAGAACSDDDGGSGGASGTGGSAGSSGAAGSAGTAGAAGTAGGGAAGSGGTGGTGGSAGSTGSGGTAGTTGGAGGTTGSRCTACLDRECTTAVDACEANTACTAILDCVISQSCGEIPEPQVCIDDCVAENPSGQATFQPLSTCVTETCLTDCSGS